MLRIARTRWDTMKGQAIATRYPLFLQKTMNSTHPKSADSDCAYSAWNAKSIFPRNWSSFQHYMGWSRQFLTWAAFTTWWAPQDQSSNCAPIYSMPSVQRIFQDFSKTWSTCYPKSIEHLSKYLDHVARVLAFNSEALDALDEFESNFS